MRSLPNLKWVNDGKELLPDILDKVWQVSAQVINKVGSIPATGATAPIVEWLAHISDKDEMEVQFFLGVQSRIS